MNVEAYLRQNQESIGQECKAISNNNSNAIITVKKDGEGYIHQVSTVAEFTDTIPDNDFFKAMRSGIRNAVVNKIIPIVVFEDRKARIISLPDEFNFKK